MLMATFSNAGIGWSAGNGGSFATGTASATMAGAAVVTAIALACSGLPGAGVAALQPAAPRNSTAEAIRIWAPTEVY